MRQHHLREVHAFTLPTELQEPEDVFVEDRPLLNIGVLVIENLRQVGVEALKRLHVRPK